MCSNSLFYLSSAPATKEGACSGGGRSRAAAFWLLRGGGGEVQLQTEDSHRATHAVPVTLLGGGIEASKCVIKPVREERPAHSRSPEREARQTRRGEETTHREGDARKGSARARPGGRTEGPPRRRRTPPHRKKESAQGAREQTSGLGCANAAAVETGKTQRAEGQTRAEAHNGSATNGAAGGQRPTPPTAERPQSTVEMR